MTEGRRPGHIDDPTNTHVRIRERTSSPSVDPSEVTSTGTVGPGDMHTLDFVSISLWYSANLPANSIWSIARFRSSSYDVKWHGSQRLLHDE